MGDESKDVALANTVAELDQTMPERKSDLPPGFTNVSSGYERYDLGTILGEGQQGTVYRAFDRGLRRYVAMKVLKAGASTVDAMARFVAEAQLTAQLNHPNIIQIFDAGTTPAGMPFYTMPMLPERTLGHVLEELSAGSEEAGEDYPLVKLMRLFSTACGAVHAAHQVGVVHRDLKPGNIIMGSFGEMLVADFGLATLAGPGLVSTDRAEQQHARTVTGAPLGTPLYMPPEQARGDLNAIGPHSDIYSLGAILYEILTLRPPLIRDNFAMQMVAIMTDMPEDPTQVSSAAPPDLARLEIRTGLAASGRTLKR